MNEFKEYLAVGEENPEAKTPRVYYNFPLDFTSTIPFKTGAWKVESRQLEPKKNVPIVSKITFSGTPNAKIQLALRVPEWCDELVVRTSEGDAVKTNLEGRYALVDVKDGQEFIVSYGGAPYAENRRFGKVKLDDAQLVLRYGPNVLAGKEDSGDKIPDVELKVNEHGSYEIPDFLTYAFEMTNEERDGAHPFVFNVKLVK